MVMVVNNLGDIVGVYKSKSKAEQRCNLENLFCESQECLACHMEGLKFSDDEPLDIPKYVYMACKGGDVIYMTECADLKSSVVDGDIVSLYFEYHGESKEELKKIGKEYAKKLLEEANGLSTEN